MGFTVYYRSVEPVAADQRKPIESRCSDLCDGRTWLSCEPVHFFAAAEPDNHLFGGSKPNFAPHADDAASAAAEALPDGTIHDALDILCKLAAEFGIDWEVSHDHSDGPIGLVRDGAADPDVIDQIEAFGNVGDILGELDIDGEFGDELGGLGLFDPDGG